MDVLLVAAALLAAGVGAAHSYLGERYILTRLFRRQDLPKLFGSDWFTRRTLRFAFGRVPSAPGASRPRVLSCGPRA